MTMEVQFSYGKYVAAIHVKPVFTERWNGL